MYSVTQVETSIGADAFIARYRDAERVRSYCSECNSFNRVWGCPPFSFSEEEYLSGFTMMRLFGTKITFDADVLARTYSLDERKSVTEQVLGEVWDTWLPQLYDLERLTPGSRIFTGRCRLCRPQECSRVHGAPCRHRRELRHSLESVGFDVVKCASELLGIELQWGRDGHLPPYLTLITAIFIP